MKQSLQTDKSEAKVEGKWDPMKETSVIDKDTEKWVEEQNKFFKNEKEKQKEGIPVKFEPRGPVKILQRQRYASTTIPSQTPRRPRDSRYSQRQHNYWAIEYGGASTNVGCVLAYIPSQVGGPLYRLPYYERSV